jgi:uncharacterized protein
MTPEKNKKIYQTSCDQIDANESDYLYVSESQIPNAGKGLFTAIPILKNEIISLYEGEIISNKEALRRAKKGLAQYFIDMQDGNILDSMNVECFAKYANDANGYVKSNFKVNSIIAFDENDNICLKAKRNIESGEEIFCSYGKVYWDNQKKEIEKSKLN